MEERMLNEHPYAYLRSKLTDAVTKLAEGNRKFYWKQTGLSHEIQGQNTQLDL